jgi:hypothetical protein
MSTDFNQLLLEQYVNDGMRWAQSVGCVLCVYGYFISTKKHLWLIILLHGIAGFVGILLENIFIAKHLCCRQEDWSYLLVMNELFWIVHESATVYYSMIKLEPIITAPKVRKLLRWAMAACFIGFAACRVMIGVFRLQANSIKNDMIDQTHSAAFLFWGVADLILFGLLVQNTISYLSSPDELRHLVTKLFQSSIPRIFVIIANTLLIVMLTQLRVSNTTQALFWAIKGTYPVRCD